MVKINGKSRRHRQLFDYFSLVLQALLTLMAFVIVFLRSNAASEWWSFREIIGCLIFFPSFGAWIKARIDLATESSFAVVPVVPSRLAQSGMFGYIQHPIYVTSYIYMMSYFLIIGSIRGVLSLLLVVAPIQFIRASIESTNLSKKFHYNYEVYCEETAVRFKKSGARTILLTISFLLSLGVAHLLVQEWPDDPMEFFE